LSRARPKSCISVVPGSRRQALLLWKCATRLCIQRRALPCPCALLSQRCNRNTCYTALAYLPAALVAGAARHVRLRGRVYPGGRRCPRRGRLWSGGRRQGAGQQRNRPRWRGQGVRRTARQRALTSTCSDAVGPLLGLPGIPGKWSCPLSPASRSRREMQRVPRMQRGRATGRAGQVMLWASTCTCLPFPPLSAGRALRLRGLFLQRTLGRSAHLPSVGGVDCACHVPDQSRASVLSQAAGAKPCCCGSVPLVFAHILQRSPPFASLQHAAAHASSRACSARLC
jgi:hypothetical protein